MKTGNIDNVNLTKTDSVASKKISHTPKLPRQKMMRSRTWPLDVMVLPALILLFIYNYIPMAGIIIAFKDFKAGELFWRSDWVGFRHFYDLFQMPESMRSVNNTLFIAISKIVLNFFVPIFIALLMNEVRNSLVKRSIQTIVYLPHFLSWVILAGILRDILGLNGIINNLLVNYNIIADGSRIEFLTNKNIFPYTIILSDVWKGFGFSTIVYMAAITSIDPSLYEAAIVDGAGRIKQTWHVTLPGMRPIIVLCLVLSLGGVLNAGFDQIYNLYSVPVFETGDIIDTFVFRLSISGGKYDLGTAVGLLKSVVSFILITTSYWLAYKFADYQIF